MGGVEPTDVHSRGLAMSESRSPLWTYLVGMAGDLTVDIYGGSRDSLTLDISGGSRRRLFLPGNRAEPELVERPPSRSGLAHDVDEAEAFELCGEPVYLLRADVESTAERGLRRETVAVLVRVVG